MHRTHLQDGKLGCEILHLYDSWVTEDFVRQPEIMIVPEKSQSVSAG